MFSRTVEPKSIVLVGIYDFRVSDYKIGIRKESSFPLHRTLCYLLLCLVVLVNGLPCLCHDNMFDVKALYVGKELWRETLPLQSGSRVYKLQGLKSNSWYEVKISYPASIPARFSLQLLKNHEMELKLNQMRRLLNTEKLIFKAESLKEVNNKAGLNVLVTLEPEGIVAIPNSRERYFIIYNIGKTTHGDTLFKLFLDLYHRLFLQKIKVYVLLIAAMGKILEVKKKTPILVQTDKALVV
ncbi:unnamed protein product [Arabidopsis thaliana]|uniref:Uncharacterized protein n=1 Tax=Arabidopsis thaliana TaxID=3702 RepID=A0A5S9WUV8_ARATH|nr:unnamed protein product [Arabidopsis thaliana]